MELSKRQKVLLAFLGIALLFYIPFTRAVILFILPLGKGIDDLVVWLALTGAGLYWAYGVLKEQYSGKRLKRVQWILIVFLAVIGSLLIIWFV